MDTLKMLARRVRRERGGGGADAAEVQGSSASSLAQLRADVTRALVQLVDAGVLPRRIARGAFAMLEENPGVVEPVAAALDVFVELRDAEDLVDTLQRISAYEFQEQRSGGSEGSSSSSSGGGSGDESKGTTAPQALESVERKAEENLAQCVDTLEAEGRLSATQASALEAYVRMHHPFVMAAHDVFLSEGDLDDLMDSLLRICARIDRSAGEEEEAEEEEEEFNEERDEDEVSEVSEEDDDGEWVAEGYEQR
jgi:hypothetical protein